MALETSRTTRYHGLTTFSHKKMVETNTSMEDIHILYPPGVNLSPFNHVKQELNIEKLH